MNLYGTKEKAFRETLRGTSLDYPHEASLEAFSETFREAFYDIYQGSGKEITENKCDANERHPQNYANNINLKIAGLVQVVFVSVSPFGRGTSIPAFGENRGKPHKPHYHIAY